MPRVRILAGLAGTDLSPGEVRDLSADEAQRHIAAGRAELIRSEAPATPERATSRERTARKSEKETRHG